MKNVTDPDRLPCPACLTIITVTVTVTDLQLNKLIVFHAQLDDRSAQQNEVQQSVSPHLNRILIFLNIKYLGFFPETNLIRTYLVVIQQYLLQFEFSRHVCILYNTQTTVPRTLLALNPSLSSSDKNLLLRETKNWKIKES